jgi:hypothetical protein
MTVTVDLSTAKHIEASAIRIIEQAEQLNVSSDQGGKVLLSLPAVLPACPSSGNLQRYEQPPPGQAG